MASFKYPRMFDRDTKHCTVNTRISDQIFQSLHLLIMSCYGELLGEPSFGASIVDVQFDKITGGTLEILKTKILNAVAKYLPALEILEDNVYILQSEDKNTVRIIIRYTLKNTTYTNVYQEDFSNVNEQ